MGKEFDKIKFSVFKETNLSVGCGISSISMGLLFGKPQPASIEFNARCEPTKGKIAPLEERIAFAKGIIEHGGGNAAWVDDFLALKTKKERAAFLNERIEKKLSTGGSICGEPLAAMLERLAVEKHAVISVNPQARPKSDATP